MKKLLVFCVLAAMLMAGCAEKQQAVDPEYKEAYDYMVKNMNTDGAEESAKEQIDMVKKYIKAADKLELDLAEQIEAAKTANGGQEAIDNAVKNGTPQSFIDISIKYQASHEAIKKYMEENNLFGDTDGQEYFKNNYWRAKHILVSTQDKSDDEKAEAEKKAKDLYEQAKSGADFDALVAENSEDPGSKSQPDGYVFTKNQMVPEFEEGVKGIEVGEFTLVETSYGWHIIKRLAIDETPELYDKFYQESGVDSQMKEDAIEKFVDEKTAE